MQAIPRNQTVHFRPWLSIWFHPRRTIQEIILTRPLRWVIPLILLSGMSGGILNWVNAVETDSDNYQENLFLSIGANLILATTTIFLFCLALHWITGWIEEEVPYSHLLSATAWGDIPSVIAPILVVLTVMVEVLVLLFLPSEIEAAGIVSLLVLGICLLGLEIWSVVLQLGALSQVMHCSVGWAIGRTIGAGLMSLIPLFAMNSLIAYFCSRLFVDTDIVLWERGGTEEENLLLSIGFPLAVLIVSAVVFFIINQATHRRKAAVHQVGIINPEDNQSKDPASEI